MSSKNVVLEIKSRDGSINPRMLRRSGRIPATIYGKGLQSVSVDVDKKTFTHVYLTQNPHLIMLDDGFKKTSALVKTVQMDPVSAEVLNVEFQQVKENEKVTLSISLVLENESPAVKLGGVLLQMMNEIEISCLPKNIPDKLVYDLAQVDAQDVAVTLADLVYPDGVTPVLSLDTPIFKVTAPKEEAEAKPGQSTEAAAG